MTSGKGEQCHRHRDLTNPDYVAYRTFLSEAELWGAEQIREWEWSELCRVLKLGWQTRGYRALYRNAGVSSLDDIQTSADFSRLPTVTKEMIRDDIDAFTLPVEGSTYTTTGGSTGIPFGFYYSPGSFARTLAARAHQYARRGWCEGDRQFVLRGSGGGSGESTIASPDHMEYVADLHELRAAAAYLEPEHIKLYLERAKAYQPDWLRVYPSAGFLFARHLKRTREEFPKLKGILSSAENLYPHQKTLMEEVFGTRVFSHYGHMEQAVLAGMCAYSDKYHVLPFYGYAELLDSENNVVTIAGGTGEIVGTSFLMESTLFIRYRTRDYAIYEGRGCPACERPYELWSSIEGRLQEFAVLSNGRLFSMTSLNMYDDVYDCIKQFQFHQDSPGTITFTYVPRAAACTPNEVERMHSRIVEKFEGAMEVTCIQVAHIPLTNRGKHRFLLQELPLDTMFP